MHKHLLTVVAGTAAVVLAGCYNPNKVVIQRRYKPAPEPTPAVQNVGELKELPAADTAKSEYAPMTDAVPTGGVDSVDSKKAKETTAASGTYVVKKGDTLGRIARRHRVKLSALMAANNMDEQAARRLRVGAKLVIPGGKVVAVSSGKKAKSVKAKNASESAPATAVGADGKYTVKSGDTPERIARRFKIKLSDLMKANNMDEQAARKLQIGQQLAIPGREAAPTSTAAETVSEPKSSVENVGTVIEDVAPVTQPGNTVAPDTTAAPKTEAVTVEISDTTASAAADVVEITADTTMTQFAAEKNISVEKLRNLNKDKTENLTKGSWVLVPQK